MTRKVQFHRRGLLWTWNLHYLLSPTPAVTVSSFRLAPNQTVRIGRFSSITVDVDSVPSPTSNYISTKPLTPEPRSLGRFNSITWAVDVNEVFAMGPATIDPRTGEILHSGIVFTNGWIKSWSASFEIYGDSPDDEPSARYRYSGDWLLDIVVAVSGGRKFGCLALGFRWCGVVEVTVDGVTDVGKLRRWWHTTRKHEYCCCCLARLCHGCVRASLRGSESTIKDY